MKIESKYLFNLLLLFNEYGSNLAWSGSGISFPNLNISDCYKFKYSHENRRLVGLCNNPTRLNLRFWFITTLETKGKNEGMLDSKETRNSSLKAPH